MKRLQFWPFSIFDTFSEEKHYRIYIVMLREEGNWEKILLKHQNIYVIRKMCLLDVSAHSSLAVLK